MAKVRLVKGPFSGKVMDINMPAGRSIIRITGPKPMTRKQRHEWMREQYQSARNGVLRPSPILDTEYQITMTMFAGHSVPCTHPDGSYFYTYVEGSKREF